MKKSNIVILQNIITYLIIGFLSLRLFYYIDKYALDIIFWDQWDFFNPLFKKDSYFNTFIYEHPPHRQGPGFVLDRLLLEISNWNTRYESFHIGFIYLLSFFIAWNIINKISKESNLYFLAIPILFLSISHFETTLIVPNPAHGAYPLLFILLFSRILLLHDSFKKYALLLIINLFLIYSGFGFFAGVIIPVIFLIKFLLSYRKKNLRRIILLSFIISILIFISFFFQYEFSTASPCFKFPHDNPEDYITYISLQYSNLFGIKKSSIPGFLTLSGLSYILIYNIYIFYLNLREKNNLFNQKNLVILFLITFPILFSIMNAIGRVCLGIHLSQSSRYYAYIIPSILGLYIFLLTYQNKIDPHFKKLVFLITFVLIIYSESNKNLEFNDVEYYFSLKTNWKNCIISEKDIDFCVNKYPIYPTSQPIKNKILYLKENHLNLFNLRYEQNLRK